MDLNQIRYFLSVARLGQVTAAAREHGVTQPAVSVALKALERDMGARLFDRRGGRLLLTAAGERFSAIASDAIERLDDGRRQAATLSEELSGPLRLGATDVAGIHFLPSVLDRFHRRYPAVEIAIQVDSSRPLVEEVVRGRIDLAFATLPVARSDIIETPIYQDRLALAVPPGHPLARGTLRAGDLTDQAFLLYRRGSTTRALIDREFAARGIRPRVIVETGYPEAMKSLVAAGLGLAVLPAASLAVEGSLGRIATRRIPGGPLVRRIGLVRRRDRIPSAPAREFLVFLERRFPSLGGTLLGTISGAPAAGAAAPAPSPGARERSAPSRRGRANG
jgi:DNA-binding transcriptional LysR family regulator